MDRHKFDDPTVCDTFWRGRLRLWQPARGHGYRFNLDPVLLAKFVDPAAHVLELGTGCGILSLLLLASGKAKHVTAVEIQPQLAQLASKNAQENGFSHEMQIMHTDLRHANRVLPAQSFDLVVFNPPYFRSHAGPASPQPGRDQARREVFGTLADFVAMAKYAVTKHGGVVAAIVPVARRDELCALYATHHLLLQREQPVQARAHTQARHVLLEAKTNDLELPQPVPKAIPSPPWVVHQEPGQAFTSEIDAWVKGDVPGGLWP